MGTHDCFKKRKENANKSFGQKPKEKESPKITILIITEGEKTEKNYLEALKKYLKITNINIIIDPKSDPTPSNLVMYAIKKKKREYDYVYCLIDRDTHDKNDIKDALSNANKNNLISIVSDPCFEYWILLHFTYTTKQFGQGEISPCEELQQCKIFKEKVINYSKTNYDFTNIITNNLSTAIINTKKVNEENENRRQSPYTQVVYLVEKLQELAKVSKPIKN